MRTYLECVPCFVRQALDAANMVTSDPAVHERVLRTTLRAVAEMRFDRSPPWMGQRIHRTLREASGDPDPYHAVKYHSNALALELYPAMKQRVRDSADPFAAAIRIAIAGNVIDFGCRTRISNEEIYQAVDKAAEASLDDAAVDDLRRAVEAAEDILYLADNAGEIVFDRLLIEELPAERVTLVVRGGPVINDATRADAKTAGLTSLVNVMDNGSDVPGTIIEDCSPEFQARFDRCDLVIAKGQGNYETLSGTEEKLFFLLMTKCPVIARHIGCPVGQFVVLRENSSPAEAGVAPPRASSSYEGAS